MVALDSAVADPVGAGAARTAAAVLRERLDEPAVVAALDTLLTHADLIAIAVSGLDGLVRRGDVITDSLVEGLAELRRARVGQSLRALADLDLTETVSGLSSLTQTAVTVAPLLDRLLRSGVVDQAAVDVVSRLAAAAVRGSAVAQANRTTTGGVFGLLRLLKDDDVARGLGLLVEVARALGQDLARAR